MAFDMKAVVAALGGATEIIELKFRDTTIKVLPQMEWPWDAVESIQKGDFTGWARDALVDGATFIAAKPTLGEYIQLLADYEKTAGIGLGKSETSPVS